MRRNETYQVFIGNFNSSTFVELPPHAFETILFDVSPKIVVD
jgi:hypothetical protein